MRFKAPRGLGVSGRKMLVEVRYETKDEINAFRHDLDFVHKGSRAIRRRVAL